MPKQIIETAHAPSPIGPYSQAVKVNGFVFVSGQIALDQATGQLVNDTIEAETTKVMEHITSILKEAGLSLENVVKASIFLSDMDLFARVNKVYGSFFQQDPPARETVEVSRLPKDVNVEISVIAAA